MLLVVLLLFDRYIIAGSIMMHFILGAKCNVLYRIKVEKRRLRGMASAESATLSLGSSQPESFGAYN